MGTRRFVALVTGWQVVASSCYYTLFAATPFVQDAFGVSRLLVGVAITTLTLGYTLFLFPSGAAVDAYGERPVLVVGLVGLAVGVVAVGLAPGYVGLLLAALVLGGAYASAMPASNRAIVGGVPAEIRGVAMGVKQVGVTVGSAVAALVVVSLAPLVATWRAGLYALGALAMLVALLFLAVYEGEPGTGDRSLPDVRGLGADPTYLALVATGLFLGAALFSTIGYTTLYLTDGVALSAGVAGIGFAAMQLSASAGRIGAGRLTDWLLVVTDWRPARASAAVLVGQCAIGTALLGGLAASSSPVVALVLVLGVGLTVIGFPGVFYACLTALVDDDEVGTATAGAQVTMNAGALVAPPAFGWLADGLGFAASWSLLAACVLAATGFAWLVFRRAPGATARPA